MSGKTERLQALLDSYARGPYRDRVWFTVAAVEAEGEAEVFDLTEPSTRHFFANGLLVHNCGEQPLLPFESCTLGSIDVGRFVELGGAAGADFAWSRLRTTIHDAVRFLDDVIDANRYPLLEIERATKATRKIGLGIMGWADALAALHIAYDSPEALALGGKLAAFLEDESLAASRALAERRGAFPAWAGSRWEDAEGQGPPLRNATTTTIAPTGTISIIAGCASGIEPLYALAYRRNVLDGAELTEVNPAFQRLARERGIASDALFAEVAAHGGVRGNPAVPDDLQRWFPTAHEVDSRVARADAGRVSASRPRRRQQDDQPRARRHPARRESCVPARVRAGLQGNHRLPGRQSRGPGARHRSTERAAECVRALSRVRLRARRAEQLPVVPALRLVGLRMRSAWT